MILVTVTPRNVIIGEFTNTPSETEEKFQTENKFLHAFAKVRKETISFLMSVYLSVSVSIHPQCHNSATIGQTFMKFDMTIF